MTQPLTNSEIDRPKRRSYLAFLPLVAFLALAALLLFRLYAGDASRLPSALIGKPVPHFALSAIPGVDKPGLATADLTSGKPTVVNVFASWCGPCREETPTLMSLSQSGIRLVGIAYKDKPDATKRFLDESGNPYQAIGADLTGSTGIDFGVYGVPETYVVKGDGTIVAKIADPLTDENIKDVILPALEKAKN